MVNRFIVLSIISSVIITGFSSWQFIKIVLWLIVVLVVFLTVAFVLWSHIKDFFKKLIRNCFGEAVYKIVANSYHLLANSPPYIFLMRVPIISGLILSLLPIIANTPIASSFLQNLFAMRSDSQLLFVMIASALTSIMIVSLSKTILALYFEENYNYRLIRILLSIGLVIPTWISIYLNSYPKSSLEVNIQTSSFILGLVMSLALFAGTALYEWRTDLPIWTKKIHFQKFDDFLCKKNLINRRNRFYQVETIVGFIFYLIVIIAYRPDGQGLPFLKEAEAPALLYLLLLIWILTFIFGGATLLFDKKVKAENTSINGFPFPILIFMVIFMGFSYSVWEVDHYFELIPIASKTESIDYQKEFKMAIKKRLSHQVDPEKTLVVVAASGGGIQASGWTTQVLAGLQQEKELGESFTNAIGLISSVSGGSVGTMFYLDQFDQGKPAPTPENLEKILSNSTDDWLDAVAWGLAFPDLVRAIGFPIDKLNKYQDRGYSLEKDWQKKLQSPATLEDWHQKILDGKIPIPVLNATLVENGSRFLISPMKFIPGKLSDSIKDINSFTNENGIGKREALDFKTLYADACKDEKINQNCTIKITTAARLSASFPYVTPMACNDRENTIKIIDSSTKEEKTLVQNYHIADGGYFDNSGLFTAIEWLDELLKTSGQELNIKKVLLIQINAFPDSQFKEQEQGDKGLDTVALGPLKALYGVKDSTQRARNIREFQLLSDRWSRRVGAIGKK